MASTVTLELSMTLVYIFLQVSYCCANFLHIGILRPTISIMLVGSASVRCSSVDVVFFTAREFFHLKNGLMVQATRPVQKR